MKTTQTQDEVMLSTASSRARILPGLGANCISLRLGDADILRTPPHAEALSDAPNVYGVPVLFPPNRIGKGVFHYAGRAYRFPINEPARGNHLHGLLSRTPFAVEEIRHGSDCDSVALVYRATLEQPYLCFPQPFLARRFWQLTQDGLLQRFTLQNEGTEPMPVGIGFHTALNACFLPWDGCADHYRLVLSAQEEILYDPKTIIPTGERRSGTPFLAQLNGPGVCPQGAPLSSHLARGKGGAALVHLPSKRCVLCSVSDNLPYWMLWNGDGHTGFICPEPQSWMVDAPNQSQAYEQSGFQVLPPKESITFEIAFKLVFIQAGKNPFWTA